MVAQAVEAEEAVSPARWIDSFLVAEELPQEYRKTIEGVHVPLAERIAARAANTQGKLLTVGLCGPQGSGKSTMVASLRRLLESLGLSVAVLSLDDLYLPLSERMALSQKVHPLLRTRGVPGTHDVPLGIRVLSSLRESGITAIPSFDKSCDDRRPRAEWLTVESPVRVLLFEGWCVGAKPQPDEALLEPVNALEREEDPHYTWRRYVNAALAGEYEHLFGTIDMLILLKAPSFDVVYRWRLQQERKLLARIRTEGGDPSRLMDKAQLARFISHYQRLTSHIMEEMPARASIVLEMDAAREIGTMK